MRHKAKGRKFSRIRKQRKALIKMILGSLIMCEKITTTEAKAKEIKSLIEKVINTAKKIKMDEKKKVAVIRELQKSIPQSAVKKLSGDFLDKFSNRSSGYTRVIKMERRKTDSARMAVIEFV